MGLPIVLAVLPAVVFPLVDAATNSIAKRMARTDPVVCLSRFVDYPPSKGKLGFPRCLFEKPFPANEKFWLKDVDFSCASPWNDECGTTRAGTLISRRHIIFAKHFPLWKGCRILFVDQAGEVCPCRIEATKAVDRSDIMIGLLDYEVTPNIHPARILPEDYAKYIGEGRGLPIVTFNQREQAFISELRKIATNMVVNAITTNANWKAHSGKMIVGDSGNPAFLLVGNEPILLYCLYSGGVGHGPAIHRYRKEIQQAMDELCPGYKLESFDFSKALHRDTPTRQRCLDLPMGWWFSPRRHIAICPQPAPSPQFAATYCNMSPAHPITPVRGDILQYVSSPPHRPSSRRHIAICLHSAPSPHSAATYCNMSPAHLIAPVRSDILQYVPSPPQRPSAAATYCNMSPAHPTTPVRSDILQYVSRYSSAEVRGDGGLSLQKCNGASGDRPL